MSIEEETPSPSKPSHFRMTRRSVLKYTVIALILLGLVCAWSRRRQWAVAGLERDGAWVIYDYQEGVSPPRMQWAKVPGPKWLRLVLGDKFFAKVTIVRFCGYRFTKEGKPEIVGRAKFTDASLRPLKSLPHVRNLDLDVCEAITDAGLANINGLTELERLNLRYTATTDRGLKHISGLSRLKYLSLNETDITDSGLEHLRGLKELTQLNLDGTKVKGPGLAYLKGLSKLATLNLNSTEVGDNDLKHLAKLGSLRYLGLGHTQVTKDGVEELQKSLPNTTIKGFF